MHRTDYDEFDTSFRERHAASIAGALLVLGLVLLLVTTGGPFALLQRVAAAIPTGADLVVEHPSERAGR